MVPTSIAINVPNANYQKDFIIFSFLRSAYSNFVKIIIETFKVSLVLDFSLPSEFQQM